MLASGGRACREQGLWRLARQFATSPSHAAAITNFSNDSQDALVNSLVQQGLVSSPRVEHVLRALDRRDFTFTHIGIPAHISYSDCQLPISQGQSISAPSLHAACLELLEPHTRPGARVLDVGAGSGYLTACFSLLVGPRGRVVALERHLRLVEQAGWALSRALSSRVGDVSALEPEPEPAPPPPPPPPHEAPSAQGTGHNIQEASGEELGRQRPADPQQQPPSRQEAHAATHGAVTGLGPQSAAAAQLHSVRLYNLELLHGNVLDDAVLAAVAAGGLFDAIHCGGSVREVPAGLVALLRPGGRLLLPVGPPVAIQSLTVVDRAADGRTVSSHVIRDVKLPPLAPPNAEKPL